ncbi:MAG: DUF4268 domain-containing protein [Candidatus Lokiarchaeota archaeon]|nr:DUF4268 domain-containing protein [Candidatus Lokiarchaeota archaeon]
MYIDKRRLRALLKWYRQEVGDDLIAALIVDRDGLLVDAITKRTEGEVERRFIGAFGALVELVLKKITKDFDLGTFGAGTFDTDKYRFIFCEAGSEFILVTVLHALSPIDPYFAYAYLSAEKIARITEGEPVSPVIPKIIVDENLQNIERKVSTLQKFRIHSQENVYKLILGGDGAVGKTSIVKRFTEGTFRKDYKATIGTSISKKECTFEGLDSMVRFVIWDLAGQPQFKRIRPTYVANSGAGILVYDVTDRDSYDNIINWYKEIKKAAPPDIFLILAGNKIDLEEERVVSRAEGEALAKELELSYIETSAKTGENVNETFKMLALQLIHRFMKAEEVYKIISNSTEREILGKKLKLDKEELKDLNYEKVPIRKIWDNVETDFTPWLRENIGVLNDHLDLDLNRDTTGFGSFSDDLIFQDELENTTIIINQFNKTDYYHLGILISKMAKHNAKNVIWICENSLEEFNTAVKWLNKVTEKDILFYIIQLEILKIEDYPPIPLFNTLVEPSQIKLALRFKNKNKELTKIQKVRIDFWIELVKKIYETFPEHSDIKIRKKKWIGKNSEVNGIEFRYIIEKEGAAVELIFNHDDPSINKNRFRKLKNHKYEIVNRFKEIAWHLSDELEWDYQDERDFQAIRYNLNDGGLIHTGKWQKIQYNMTNAMKSLKGATYNKIVELFA